jgi:flagellar assembly protein FliH
MRCKIADSSQDPEPIRWRSVPEGSGRSLVTHDSGAVSPSEYELSQIQAQLKASEARHQGELAQVRQQALAEGMRQAHEETAAQIKLFQDNLAQTLASLANTKRKLRAEGEGELLKLSLAIARRILHRELIADPEALQGLVHTALQKLQNREISIVRVYPGGADAVRSALERIGAAPAIQVIADPGMKNGDIVFETSFGDLDASIDSQLAEIQRGFADRLALR